jgi:hypothetical protein
MTKFLLRVAVALLALGFIPSARAQDRSPIVYNFRGDEVGVIQRAAPNGDAIMLPTKGTLDLGYYDVSVPSRALHPRPAGGWVTTLSNDQIAFLPPVPYRFFQPSGD